MCETSDFDWLSLIITQEPPGLTRQDPIKWMLSLETRVEANYIILHILSNIQLETFIFCVSTKNIKLHNCI